MTSPEVIALAEPSIRVRPERRSDRVAFVASWEFYLSLCEAVGNQHVRTAYDGKRVELMSPGPDHEDANVLLAGVVRALSAVLGVPCKGLGSTRWLRPEVERGIEPDRCFFFTREKIAVVKANVKDADRNTIPDLMIEIDMSPPRVDRAGIYAALGVAEVWRFDGETLRIDRLGPDGTYTGVAESGFLSIRADELVFLLRTVAAEADDDNDFARRVTEWARAVVLPRVPG